MIWFERNDSNETEDQDRNSFNNFYSSVKFLYENSNFAGFSHFLLSLSI